MNGAVLGVTSRAMTTFLLILQALIGAALVGVILMQQSEGGGLGMGGSPSGLMSARGAADFLTRATAVLATLFVALSIVQAVRATRTTAPVIDTSLARPATGTPAVPTPGAPVPVDPLAPPAGVPQPGAPVTIPLGNERPVAQQPTPQPPQSAPRRPTVTRERTTTTEQPRRTERAPAASNAASPAPAPATTTTPAVPIAGDSGNAN